MIVLGTYGTKHWQIALHSSTDATPIGQAEEIPSEALEEHNSIKRDLRNGQLLYIPRGFAHQAVASTEPTLHITIGLKPWSWLDLVTEALKSFSEDESLLRQRVPLAWSEEHELGDEALKNYQQILTKLTARRYLESGLERLSNRFVTHSTTSLRRRLVEMIQGIQVGPETKLRMRPGTVASVKKRGESVILRYPSREVTLPAFAAPTIEKILTGEDLDLDGRLLLAQKLVDQHLLVPDER